LFAAIMVSVLARPPVRLTYRVVRIAVETAGFDRGLYLALRWWIR